MLAFKYLVCMVNNRGTKKECESKVMNRRRTTGAIKAQVNKKRLILECGSVLQESFFYRGFDVWA